MTADDLKKEYRVMLATADLSERELAERLGVVQQGLNRKISQGTVRLIEFAEIIDKLGFEIEFKQKK